MAPVTAIADFPAAAGVAAGVDLGPDGLTLFVPAAGVVAEAGFYANPAPEYGDLFDFPEELDAPLEATFSVSQ